MCIFALELLVLSRFSFLVLKRFGLSRMDLIQEEDNGKKLKDKIDSRC